MLCASVRATRGRGILMFHVVAVDGVFQGDDSNAMIERDPASAYGGIAAGLRLADDRAPQTAGQPLKAPLPSSVLYTQVMTNAPELLARLQEVNRCMELELPSAADEVRTACRALAQATEAESPEIAAAGLELAKAAEGVSDSNTNLRLHLSLQSLMSRLQAAAESSQAGRVWAAAQNLALIEMLPQPAAVRLPSSVSRRQRAGGWRSRRGRAASLPSARGSRWRASRARRPNH
jgi:hypothetical protein